LKDFPDAIQPLPDALVKADPVAASKEQSAVVAAENRTENKAPVGQGLTKEQLKLERANVINDVLSKRILKAKGPMYDELERSVRHFLNGELGKIFGNAAPTSGFSNEEVELLKFFCERLKSKEGN
jgi:hypothetical protein